MKRGVSPETEKLQGPGSLGPGPDLGFLDTVTIAPVGLGMVGSEIEGFRSEVPTECPPSPPITTTFPPGLGPVVATSGLRVATPTSTPGRLHV